MIATENLFERIEKKYVLSAQQHQELMCVLGDMLVDDEYPEGTIQSVYYDTPGRVMFNRSLGKPPYKEKLRVRAYGSADADSVVYVELKKKYKGVVHKRRFALGREEASLYLTGMPYDQAVRRSVCRGIDLPGAHDWNTLQTVAEFDACLARYQGLEPAMMVVVDRVSKRTADGSDVRITFDHAPRWRDANLELSDNLSGNSLFAEGVVVMEVKCSSAYPLWLAQALSMLRIYPQSCSKVGRAYQAQQERSRVAHTPVTTFAKKRDNMAYPQIGRLLPHVATLAG